MTIYCIIKRGFHLLNSGNYAMGFIGQLLCNAVSGLPNRADYAGCILLSPRTFAELTPCSHLLAQTALTFFLVFLPPTIGDSVNCLAKISAVPYPHNSCSYCGMSPLSPRICMAKWRLSSRARSSGILGTVHTTGWKSRRVSGTVLTPPL